MTAYRFIQAEKARHAVSRLCGALSVSRAAFYARQRSPLSARAQEDRRLGVHIRAAYPGSRGTYGSSRVTRELEAEGLAVGRRRVARLMRWERLEGVPRRRWFAEPPLTAFEASARRASRFTRWASAPWPARPAVVPDPARRGWTLDLRWTATDRPLPYVEEDVERA